ncbi:enoyl-CoA hydratase/isomerase family protein [Limisalsivibrio acetivorans]|uniref:enoyl-CoA hydratase/isomerase family protein n=1 Tax=Limisalsivibrio acetivorans TaxID=1304888 RepID=UPI0003B54F67|nr:enoyl-CoA hydratase-related protein [Limisalsivibrio acetivorans]
MEETVLVEMKDDVAVVTINRPKAMNSIDPDTISALGEAVADLAVDPDVSVIILTGAGEKAFVAGGDIKGMTELDGMGGREMALDAQSVFNLVEKCPKPVIAAINGYALGGGCELALCCDIRLAAKSAKIGQPEVNLGIIPGFGGTQRLPRLVGRGLASEMIFTGEMVTAEYAERIGLVNHVYEDGELMDKALEMAVKIAEKSRTALKLSKEAIVNGTEMDLDKGCLYEADLFGLSFSSADKKEGVSAFIEKRKPEFKDV